MRARRRRLRQAADDEGLPGPKKRRTGRSAGKLLPPELAASLGDAHSHFARGRHAEAMALLSEVIRQAPSVPDSYHTLGLIYEERDEKKLALQMFVIAAHLTPKDAEIWHKVALVALEVDDREQALYSFGRALKLAPADVGITVARAQLLAATHQHAKAVDAYMSALRHCQPADPRRARIELALAESARSAGNAQRARTVLGRLIAVAPPDAAANAAASDDDDVDDDETGEVRDDDEVRFEALALLVAIEMGAAHWAAAIRAIEQCHAALQAPDSGSAAHAQLPLDLVVNYGICQLRHAATKGAAARADDIARALPCFRVVMEQDAREPHIAQLLAALGDAFEGVDEHYRALVVLKRLLSATAPADACRELHVRIAWCVRVVDLRAHVPLLC